MPTISPPDIFAIEKSLQQTHAEVLPSETGAPSTESAPMTDVKFEGSFWLGSLQHPKWRLHTPLRLALSRSDDQIVLEWPEANSLFGYGDRLSSAVTDFRLALVELYESLSSSAEDELGPEIIPVRALLNETIGPTGAA